MCVGVREKFDYMSTSVLRRRFIITILTEWNYSFLWHLLMLQIPPLSRDVWICISAEITHWGIIVLQVFQCIPWWITKAANKMIHMFHPYSLLPVLLIRYLRQFWIRIPAQSTHSFCFIYILFCVLSEWTQTLSPRLGNTNVPGYI